MRRVVVSLSVSASEYLAWYQGAAQTVYATTVDGRSVRFPARILQPFVTSSGVSGTFAIEFDDNNRFQQIKRLK
jgi:hypothetical protein